MQKHSHNTYHFLVDDIFLLQKCSKSLLPTTFSVFCLYNQITENGIQRQNYSGTVFPPLQFISSGNSILLLFQSDGSTTDKGFRLKYQSKLDGQTKMSCRKKIYIITAMLSENVTAVNNVENLIMMLFT